MTPNESLTFESLKLIEPILKNLKGLGYINPTPVQGQAIPYLLGGRDLLGCAQTGTGKTAAFALPILHKLVAERNGPKQRSAVRALILSPTRELASQISDSFRTYGRGLGLSQVVVFGGVGYIDQVRAIERGVDILVATPGRLLDLVQKRIVDLSFVEVFVIDEADQMFDMGFVNDMERIIAELPKKRQTILFSATMPPAIARLANNILTNPERLIVSTVASTNDNIQQQVLFVSRRDKLLVLRTLMEDASFVRAIVFSRTKHGADKIVDQLGDISESIHGGKRQPVRRRILDQFKKGRFKVLVATDVVARGIDVDGITHVINYDLPNVAESYVHRIGRTGRAGAQGVAISLCDRDERGFLHDIERLTQKRLTVLENSQFNLPAEPAREPREGGFGGRRSGGYQGNGGSSNGGGSRFGGGQGQRPQWGNRSRRPSFGSRDRDQAPRSSGSDRF